MCDGTPLSEISGSYIGIYVGYIFIYVPSDDSIITIQAGTRLGQGYYVDKDYTYHFKNGINKSSLCWLVDFDSNGGTAVESVYVHNGATVSAPTAPTKATVGNTEYTFRYWEDEGGDEFSFSTVITANTILTAVWTEQTIVNITFVGFLDVNNNPIGNPASFYLTRVNFDHIIGTGVNAQKDFSNLNANMTYTGSSNVYSLESGNGVGFDPNLSDYDFLYLKTMSAPETGDTIMINAGAWFTVGGTDTNKYVISSDIVWLFNGNTWQLATSFNVYDSINGGVAGTYYHLKDGDNFVYRMPTDLYYEGYKVFGFAITDNEVEYFYPAGGTHTSENNNLSVIAIIGTFDMVNGASIRITTAESSGIRWTANVDSASKGHVLYWGKDGTTYGTEISADGFSSNFDIKTNYWASDTSYNAVLTDINSDYYNTAFTAKAYVDIVYSDGTTARIYADNTGITRNIRQVAAAALDDADEYSVKQIEVLTAIAGL
ncbi:MAG: InlB B-repeat-containing protein [Clostridia bacterium]|nr:InlB B-repeat-containing protein [Clostridia bacterium]